MTTDDEAFQLIRDLGRLLAELAYDALTPQNRILTFNRNEHGRRTDSADYNNSACIILNAIPHTLAPPARLS
jgi:hypothetical protein